MANKFCTNCGAPLAEGAKFCESCGTPVPAAAPQPTYVPAQPQQAFAPPSPPPQPQYAAPQPQYAVPQPQPKKRSGNAGKFVVSAICLVLAAAILFTGFVAPGFALKKGGAVSAPTLSGGGEKQTLSVTPEQPTAESDTGVKVELAPSLFDYDETLEVSVRSAGMETAENGEYQITAYDISIGDLHELDTYIDIRIPYDGSFCDAGEDPAACVGAKYYNDASGLWEDVLFDVDAEAREVVIHTDHLSRYGCFEVKNAGRRNAYITSISDFYLGEIPIDKAAAAMATYAQTGIHGDSAIELGMYVANKVIAQALEDVSAVGDALDIVSNTYSGFQLNDIQFFTKMASDANSTLSDTLSDLGIFVSAAKLGLEVAKDNKSSEDILNIYKDAGMLAMNIAANTAYQQLGKYMVGIWLIDKSITDLGKAARNIRMENWETIYVYYNDKWQDPVHQGAHRARTTAEWRDLVAKAAQASHGDRDTFQYLLEAQVDAYARRFFNNEPEEDIEEIQHIVEHTWRGALSASEKEEIITKYKQNLYQRLTSAIFVELQNDYQRRVEAEFLAKLQALKEELNRSTAIHIYEDLEEGEQPQFGGYTLRFAPLSADANVQVWTGIMPDDGDIDTVMTLIGWLVGGQPDRIDFWPAGKNPDTDEPEFSVPFNFNLPSVEVPVKAERFPAFEELLGFYESGNLTITEVSIPPELEAALEGASTEGGEEGCDLNIDLKSLVGETRDAPFTLEAAGENTFLITGDGGISDIMNVPLVYDGRTGTCPAASTVIEEEGESWRLTISMECSYSDELKSGVIVGFDLKLECLSSEFAGIIVYIKMAGEKALT